MAALAPAADVVVIVDVLRFTTCIDVATGRQAIVFPYPWRDQTAAAFAVSHQAELAGLAEDPSTPWSLSPADLSRIPAGTRLVLPSPNGSTLARIAGAAGTMVLAGCLRNASAVAAAALAGGDVVAVIAAGERWRHSDGPLRPSLEDLLGSGAVIAAALDQLDHHRTASVEALAAAAVFTSMRGDLSAVLAACHSGRELTARGWSADVEIAAAHDVSDCSAILREGAFVAN